VTFVKQFVNLRGEKKIRLSTM